MKLNYRFKKQKWSYDFDHVPIIFLPNYHGGYYTDFSSRYSGLFFNINGEMFKILDQVTHNLGEITEATNCFNLIEQCYNNNKVRYCFFNGDVFGYEFVNDQEFFLDFDIRKSYDMDDNGRMYQCSEKDGRFIIKYEKIKDNNKEYQVWAVITPIEKSKIEIMEHWYEKDYGFDQSRGSNLYKRYVRRTLKINGKGFVINVADNLSTAIKRAKEIDKIPKLSSKNKRSIEKAIIPFDINNYFKTSILALNSFLSLNFNNTLLAGLPWFFQRWSRDELISLPGLLYLSRPENVKNILIEYLSQLKDCILKIHKTAGDSFDAVGWLFKRTKDYYDLIKNIGGKPLKHEQKEMLIQKLSEIIVTMNSKEDFVVTEYNQSWMDTVHNSFKRTGASIEHQVMILTMYDLLYELTKEHYLIDKKHKWEEKIKKTFFGSDYYIDTLDDDAIRPNIFLAYYIYPKLFSNKEWEVYFDYAIKHLWLDWGGFSTVNKEHPSFKPNYTGEDNASYHRGDSWYWINNIAAVVLHSVNKSKYKIYTEKILEASTFDLEKGGFIGFCSEVSSASHLASEGCLNQLWSASTYLEMLDKLKLR